jgi:hypothetical protein
LASVEARAPAGFAGLAASFAVTGFPRPSSCRTIRSSPRKFVGLYLNPPDKALVLCIDEKSQIQALDRAASASFCHRDTDYTATTRYELGHPLRAARNRGDRAASPAD